MGASPAASGGFFSSRFQVGRAGLSMLLFLVLVLPACSSSPASTVPLDQFVPLRTDAGELTAERAVKLAPTPELLALDDEMRAFVSRYTGGVASDRERLNMLHGALIGAGAHDLHYDPFADGTAREAFHRGGNGLDHVP